MERGVPAEGPQAPVQRQPPRSFGEQVALLPSSVVELLANIFLILTVLTFVTASAVALPFPLAKEGRGGDGSRTGDVLRSVEGSELRAGVELITIVGFSSSLSGTRARFYNL